MEKNAKGGILKEKAIFASGCFWSKEYFFNQQKGVLKTRVGYTGGHTLNPTYKEVCTKKTGHAEAVEVTFDANVTSFENLAKVFFQQHDPTIDRTGKGGQYRSAIFYSNPIQKEIAEKLKQQLIDNDYDVSTQIVEASTFWEAEEKHQKYCEVKGFTPKNYFQERF